MTEKVFGPACVFASLSLTSSIIDAREGRYLRMLIIPHTVLASELIALFDEPHFSARSASRSAHADSAQRRKIIGKDVARRLGGDYLISPAPNGPQPEAEPM